MQFKAHWKETNNTLPYFLWLAILCSLSAACSKGSQSQAAPATPASPPAPLVWESSSHPERMEWSSALNQIVEKNMAVLDLASDIDRFCPPYNGLSADQKVNVWDEIFAATSFYESGWEPTAASADNGTPSDQNTWSVGLLQVSVVDQKTYDLNFGDDFADLQDPVKNLTLAVAIMAHQVQTYGLVLIPVGGSGYYWSTLHPGGKHDQSGKVISQTLKLRFCQSAS